MPINHVTIAFFNELSEAYYVFIFKIQGPINNLVLVPKLASIFLNCTGTFYDKIN